jgi:cytochrome oxidase Cu insertion factor (SCO1/SenC/PrrC family)
MNKPGIRIGLALVGIGVVMMALSELRSRSGDAANLAYGTVPEFTLTESSGRTVRLQDLQGKVWIADFIFTSCAGSCPAMTGQMRRLQDTLPLEIALVSFSVDPKRDTPDVLARYAKEFHADPQRWMFLTGDRETLYNVSVTGFKLSLDESQGTEQEPITHSSRFVLVDRNFQIRGYYSGTEADDFNKLVREAKGLL